MNRRRLKFALEYAGYRALKWPLHALPHAQVRRVGHALGWLAYAVVKSRRRIALSNLAMTMPHLSPAQRSAIARRCFMHFGAVFCELISAEGMRAQKLDRLFQIEGMHHLQAAIAQNKGVFVMTGHLGSWELGAYPLGARAGDLEVVARPPNNPHIAAEAARLRERFNNRVIGKSGATARILAAIRARHAVAMVIDIRAGRSGRWMPFLGHPAWIPTAMAIVALSRGVPIVPVFCRPQGHDGYRLRIQPAIQPRGRGEQAEAALTRQCLALIEAEVRRTPAQWLWMHNLWRP